MFFCKIAFIVSFCFSLTTANGQRSSPCPSVFEYEHFDIDQEEWNGKIFLTTTVELSGVWLRVHLDRPANVLINRFGESTTTDNKNFIIKNPNKILRPQEDPLVVKFTIKYENNTIPYLAELRLNGRTICKASVTETESSEATTIFYSQRITERPFSETSTNINKLFTLPTKQPEYFEGDFALTPNRQKNISAFTPVLDRASVSEECGLIVMKPSPLITHGKNSFDGEWPWHLAIYHSEGVHLTYICGGSIISKNHVITASHCVTKPRTKDLSNLSGILLYLGTTNLKHFGPGIQVHQISQAQVHPDYNPNNLYNDIAVLKLQRPIEYTNYVRPICLWEDEVDINKLENTLGTVVGWGYDENNQITENLMQIKMPVVSLSTCIYSNREFFSTFTFEKNYCAGFRNGTSVCSGDSGGGMVFPKTRNPNRWQLRGLVSIGVALQGQSCNPTQFVIFTDVAKHLDWIKEKIQ